MPGTIRKAIDRIKDVRSGGNSVVALTIETRLVLQGFDPLRFGYEDADDPARLARLREVASEMDVDIDDLIAAADVEPDPDAEPRPIAHPPARSAAAVPRPDGHDAAAASGAGAAAAVAAEVPDPEIDDDHPLHQFRDIADEVLDELGNVDEVGARSGATTAQVLKASLLMALYSVSSDRALCDQIRHNSLYRWFLGLRPGEGRFEPKAFSADREQVLASRRGHRFFDRVVPRAGRNGLFRSESLEVNGRLLKGWMTPEKST